MLGDYGYTPDSRNRYESITTGNTRTAIGRAPASWDILVNDAATDGRIGELYYKAITAPNENSPVWKEVITRRASGFPRFDQHLWFPAQEVNPSYDDDGNLTDDGRWTYLWGAENRLIQMESNVASTTAGHPFTRIQFVYDWQGRRIARHIWQGGTSANPTFKSSHRWLYDGWNVVTQFTAPSNGATPLTRTQTYTWGLDLSGTLQGAGGVGGLLLITDHSALPTHFYPSYDGNGNIIAWTKSDGTAPVARREYDAFGNMLVAEGTAPCAFGFSTKMREEITGLYYYGYRFYDPLTGRWPSRDPIEEQGGVNLYGIVGNDGINQWDILGWWYTDGRPVFTVDESNTVEWEKHKDNALAKRSWTIVLNGSGGYRPYEAEIRDINSHINDAAKAHEERHIAAVKASSQSHAVPYKQVFCTMKIGEQTGKYFYIQRSNGKLQPKEFDPKKDRLEWEDGVWILYMSYDERKQEEAREITQEVADLDKILRQTTADVTKKNLSKRIGALNNELGKLNNDNRTGNIKHWDEFKLKYTELKSGAGSKGFTFSWYDESKVYDELK